MALSTKTMTTARRPVFMTQLSVFVLVLMLTFLSCVQPSLSRSQNLAVGDASHTQSDSSSSGQVGVVDEDNDVSGSFHSQKENAATTKAELHERKKRYSNFVRVGKDGTFLRIGKSPEDSELPNDDFQADYLTNLPSASKRQMHRFIRIGRDGQSDDSLTRTAKASSFVRIGKAPSSFVRIGRSFADPDSVNGKRGSSFVRIGKSYDELQDEAQAAKRASSFVRIGKRPSSFVRIGKSPQKYLDLGYPAYPSTDIDADFPVGYDPQPSHLGQSSLYDNLSFNIPSKRPSSFVRIGKRSPAIDSLKRASSFVRIGKSSDDIYDVKRPSSFVRIGKSFPGTDDEVSKRPSSFVRIGKGSYNPSDLLRVARLCSSTSDHPYSPICQLINAYKSQSAINAAQKKGFVRIGKKDEGRDGESGENEGESLKDGNQSEDEGPINVASRSSAFVRIGKIPSSAFVRIGKNTAAERESERNRVSRGGQSSFVRIGK